MKRSMLACLALLTSGAAAAQTAPLTFDQAIGMAVSASHKREQAEQELESQVARRREALAELGPKAKVGYTQAKFDKAVTTQFGSESITLRPDEMKTGTVSVHQPVFGLYSAWEKANLERVQRDSAELGVEQAKVDAAFMAGEAYRRAQQTEELLKIAQASIAATESQQKDAKALLQSGRLIQSEFLKIQIANLDAKTQLAKATAARDKAYEVLRVALGLPDGAPLTAEPFPQASAVESDGERSYADALKASEAARLDVKQAALSVEKADYAVQVAHAKFAPNVDVFIKWDREYGEPAFGQPDFTRSYGVQATWDIWDNGSRVFAEHEVAAQQRKAESVLNETKDRMRAEIYALLADLKAAKESVSLARANVGQAEEAYRLDQARFRNGLVTATDLVSSEAVQTKARGALVSAAAEADVLLWKLQRSLGEKAPHVSLANQAPALQPAGGA